MGLKIATFQITNRFGGVENIFLTWRKIIDADLYFGGNIGFSAFENQTESARQNQKDIFKMPVSAQDILAMFTQSGLVALVVSDYSWTLAQTTKFIPDYNFNEETNQWEMQLKSLSDLNAAITDIGNPFV